MTNTSLLSNAVAAWTLAVRNYPADTAAVIAAVQAYADAVGLPYALALRAVRREYHAIRSVS